MTIQIPNTEDAGTNIKARKVKNTCYDNPNKQKLQQQKQNLHLHSAQDHTSRIKKICCAKI